MIAVLSPAKNMRAASMDGLELTLPQFREQTEQLASQLKGYQPYELESLMKISPGLALRAFQDYQDFRFDQGGSAAALSYHGLAYQNLNAADFSLEDFAFASKHLRILSAVYGLLRPADAIRPYRLELQCRIKIENGSLYQFWGDRIYRALFAEGRTVINLASGEYARVVQPYVKPEDRWITCDFLVRRRGRLVTLATGAKMARGQMARAIIKNRWQEPECLRQFVWEGYEFCEELSSPRRYAFILP